MPTPEQLAASTLYANLMDEIKVRITAIDAGTLGRLGLPAVIVREFCYLQFRMICELIALSCLVAHGDITKATGLRKQWAADKIIEEIEKLHPTFFPIAYKEENKIPGHHHIEPVDCMTKEELLKLYYECGRVLYQPP